MKKGNLVIISGPAGIGKGTVCKEIVAARPDIKLSVSWTTRDIRPGETAGVTYHYRTEEEFQKNIDEGGFLEYAGKFGSHYGTPKAFVDENIKQGNSVILEIESQGAFKVMEKQKENVISIFLLPPSMKELYKRLSERGRESMDKVNARFQAAYDEFEFVKKYQYYIVNDNLKKTKQIVEDIIDGKPYQNEGCLDDILKALQEEKVL